jgi:hypothetical protein
VFGAEPLQSDVYGDGARRRQLLWMVARAHAVVWFGPPDPAGVDLPTLADRIGVPSRSYPAADLAALPAVTLSLRRYA